MTAIRIEGEKAKKQFYYIVEVHVIKKHYEIYMERFR